MSDSLRAFLAEFGTTLQTQTEDQSAKARARREHEKARTRLMKEGVSAFVLSLLTMHDWPQGAEEIRFYFNEALREALHELEDRGLITRSSDYRWQMRKPKEPNGE